MKTKKFKRILTLVLALAMMLSLSMVAFADGEPDGSVDIIIRFATYNLTTHQYSYSEETPIPVDFYAGDTAYDVVVRAFGTDAAWNYTSGLYYLEELEYNNVNYQDIRVEADASCYDEDDFYIGGNAIIDSLNQTTEFSTYGGVYMSWAMLWENPDYEGYYYLRYGNKSCSITYDWQYDVDFVANGYGDYVIPMLPAPYDNYQAAMNQCNLSDGDVIRLTYGLTWIIW